MTFLKKSSVLRTVALVAASLLLCVSRGWAETDAEREALIAKVSPYVCKVCVELEKGMGHGSGYIIDPTGTAITNAHVVKIAKRKDVKKVYITFPADKDHKQYETEGFLDVLPTRDLALVRFKPAGKKCKALKLANKDPMQGETVFTFGSPLGWDNTISIGMVTAVRTGKETAEIFDQYGKGAYEKFGYSLEASWIQHNAPISPGNSGGPLLNLRGEVLGLNTWNANGGQNLNFATTWSNIKYFLAGASKLVKPWKQLPDWKGAGEDEGAGPSGAAGITMQSWIALNRAKNGLSDRLQALEGKLEKIPDLDSRMLRGQRARNKKLSIVYKDFSKAYAEYAVKVRAANKEFADVNLIMLIVSDAEAAEQISSSYQLVAAAVLEQENTRSVEMKPIELKEKMLPPLRNKYDMIRVVLGRTYGIMFPGLEETRAADAKKKKSDTDKSDKAEGGKKGDKSPSDGDDSAGDSDDSGYRFWTSFNGKYQIKAKLIRLEEDDMVVLKLAKEGKILKVPLEKLSEADQRYIHDAASK